MPGVYEFKLQVVVKNYGVCENFTLNPEIDNSRAPSHKSRGPRGEFTPHQPPG